MKKNGVWMKAVMIVCAISSLTGCHDNAVTGKGEGMFEITDAPSDDASIKGAFVTVTDVRVDGTSLSGFTKQTIDLAAYQHGTTKMLGSAELSARTYNTITLVLDLDKDAGGNTPGCYVLSQDNVKYKLANSTTSSGKAEISLNKAWAIKDKTTTNVVMDFDLRKALKYSDDATIRFAFASAAGLNSAVRVVDKGQTGTINGTYSEQAASHADKVVVYAYKKGTFTASTETVVQGEDKVAFKNAVNSAEIQSSLSGNTYKLVFLEPGDYELHFAAFAKDSAGKFAFTSMLLAETKANGTASSTFSVQAGMSLNISANITGIIN